MINQTTIIVFDFETGGLDTAKLEPLSLAAIALDPRTLQEKDRWQAKRIRPLDMNNLSQGALDVNGIKREELMDAPEQKLVWAEFAKFCKKHNPKGASPFSAPIAAGKNIRNFDLPIAERLCRTYGNVDKGGRPNLFNPRKIIDLEDLIWSWFENSDDLENYKMDTLRAYFGMSTEGAHDAMVDTEQTAELIVRILRLQRWLKSSRNPDNSEKIKFRNCCVASTPR